MFTDRTAAPSASAPPAVSLTAAPDDQLIAALRASIAARYGEVATILDDNPSRDDRPAAVQWRHADQHACVAVIIDEAGVLYSVLSGGQGTASVVLANGQPRRTRRTPGQTGDARDRAAAAFRKIADTLTGDPLTEVDTDLFELTSRIREARLLLAVALAPDRLTRGAIVLR